MIPCHYMGNKGLQFMFISYFSVDKHENTTRLFLPFAGMIETDIFSYTPTTPKLGQL